MALASEGTSCQSYVTARFIATVLSLPEIRGESDLSFFRPQAFNRDLCLKLLHQAGKFLSPFDQHQIPFVGDNIFQSKRLQLALRIESIQIDVIDGMFRPAIFMD